jgi:hypothetical protein
LLDFDTYVGWVGSLGIALSGAETKEEPPWQKRLARSIGGGEMIAPNNC